MINFTSPRQGNKRWSEADTALLRELAETETIGTIALRLGRTRASIETRARDLGLRLKSSAATIARSRRKPPAKAAESKDGE